MNPDQTQRILEAQGTTYTIPNELIRHESIKPVAFDGVTLWLGVKMDGIEICVSYVIGPNMRAFFRKEDQGEVKCTIKGSILNFQKRLSWEQLERISERCVVRLVDALKPKASGPHNALQNFMMERLVSLTVGVATDDPAQIEYVLRFQDELEFKDRIKRENASDIFG